MIYFKKVNLEFPDNKVQFEKALRKVSLKRERSLDFSAGGMMAGTDKRFFGNEGKKHTNFSRIRYYVGDFMPRIIVSFPKDEHDQFYKMRLSLITTVIFCVLSLMFLVGIATALFNPDGIEAFFTFFITYFIFMLLLFWEIKLTTKQINAAVFSSQNAIV